MFKVIKKCLLFLFILVIASVFFNVSNNESVSSSASDIIEIIEDEDQEKEDGYIEDKPLVKEETNVFASVISFLASLIQGFVQFIINIITKVISTFASIKYIY